MSGFVNFHPFFVHAPLVLIPTAALMVWLGRTLRGDGFATATLLVTIAAALTAFAAVVSGFFARSTLAASVPFAALVRQHQINGVVITLVASVAALLAIAEWRGLLGGRAWWLRAALLSWAAIGCAFSGHNGASLVYLHGAGVAAPLTGVAAPLVESPYAQSRKE